MTNIATEAEAAAVARVMKENLQPSTIEVTHDGIETELLVVPRGCEVQSPKKFVDELRDRPRHREGTARFFEMESFIVHANRFKDADSALFAKADEPSLTSVLDYHHANTFPNAKPVGAGEIVREGATFSSRPSPDELLAMAKDAVHGEPRFGKHRGVYTFPVSDEWDAWKDQDDEWMDQAKFAAFIEERIVDVTDPKDAFGSARELQEALGDVPFAGPSTLLTLANGLYVHVNSRVANKVQRATGETQMMFETSHTDEAGEPLKVPRAFMIKVPVFKHGTLYRLGVRLNYRIQGAQVVWSYKLHAADRAFNDAFRESCEHAHETTGLPLFYGAPEGT